MRKIGFRRSNTAAYVGLSGRRYNFFKNPEVSRNGDLGRLHIQARLSGYKINKLSIISKVVL